MFLSRIPCRFVSNASSNASSNVSFREFVLTTRRLWQQRIVEEQANGIKRKMKRAPEAISLTLQPVKNAIVESDQKIDQSIDEIILPLSEVWTARLDSALTGQFKPTIAVLLSSTTLMSTFDSVKSWADIISNPFEYSFKHCSNKPTMILLPPTSDWSNLTTSQLESIHNWLCHAVKLISFDTPPSNMDATLLEGGIEIQIISSDHLDLWQKWMQSRTWHVEPKIIQGSIIEPMVVAEKASLHRLLHAAWTGLENQLRIENSISKSNELDVIEATWQSNTLTPIQDLFSHIQTQTKSTSIWSVFWHSLSGNAPPPHLARDWQQNYEKVRTILVAGVVRSQTLLGEQHNENQWQKFTAPLEKHVSSYLNKNDYWSPVHELPGRAQTAFAQGAGVTFSCIAFSVACVQVGAPVTSVALLSINTTLLALLWSLWRTRNAWQDVIWHSLRSHALLVGELDNLHKEWLQSYRIKSHLSHSTLSEQQKSIEQLRKQWNQLEST